MYYAWQNDDGKNDSENTPILIWNDYFVGTAFQLSPPVEWRPRYGDWEWTLE
jgi:hypothetical protein